MTSDNVHPWLIILQTTSICNGKCKVCPYPDSYSSVPKEVMSNQLWNKIYSELRDIKYKGYIGFYLQYEPLTDPLLLYRIHQLNDIGIYNIQVTTNGSMVTMDFLQKFKKVIGTLCISLLGAGEAYNQMTGFDYNRIKGIIKLAEFNEVNVRLNCSISDLKQREQIRKDFESLDNKGLICFSIPDSRAGYFDNISSTPAEWCLKEANNDIMTKCVGMGSVLSIFYDGKVPFCPQDWSNETNYGNIHTDTIMNIFNNSKYRTDFDKLGYSILTNQICKNCYKELGFK